MELNIRKMYPVETAILDARKLTRETITNLAEALEGVIADVEKGYEPDLTLPRAALARLNEES